MALEADFLKLMVDQVGVEFRTGLDGYGQPSFGPKSFFKARVEAVNMRVLSPSRSAAAADFVERVASSKCYVVGAPRIGEFDRITLPDQSQPVILKVEVNGDERGAHHQVVYS